MHATVAHALCDRLGPDAANELLDAVDTASSEASERMLNLAVERFERRLAEELAELRVALVREIHDGRTDVMKRAFAFWVGQLAAVAALVGVALRSLSS